VIWLLYGNEIFLTENKECLKVAPLLTYTLLFVLILGFVHAAKFAFILLGLTIWMCCKYFDIPFSIWELFASEEQDTLQQ
jgi:hypothetical protein